MPLSVTNTVSSQISTANTARDGTGTLGTVVTAATNGSKVSSVTITATGTTTAGVIRLFIFDGTTTRLIAEILVPAITPSVSVAVWSFTWTPPAIAGVFGAPAALDIPPSGMLKASTNNAEVFNLLAIKADN